MVNEKNNPNVKDNSSYQDNLQNKPNESKKTQFETQLQETSAAANSLARRLRILEDRYSNLRRKMQLTDNAVLNGQKKIFNEIKTIDLDLSEIKKEIFEIKSQASIITSEFLLLAKKEDVKAIQKYIELWEPLKFMTKREADEMLKREIERFKRENLERFK